MRSGTLVAVLTVVGIVGLSAASCGWLNQNTETGTPADPTFVCHKDGEGAGATEQCCSGKTREANCEVDPAPCGPVTCCSGGPGCS